MKQTGLLGGRPVQRGNELKVGPLTYSAVAAPAIVVEMKQTSPLTLSSGTSMRTRALGSKQRAVATSRPTNGAPRS